MKIKDAIAYVDSVKPNAFDDAAKILWLNEVEGLVQTEAMLFAVEDLIEYTADTSTETELLVKSPHDKIYRAYLVAMVDFANGEYNRYANTVEMFNTYFSEYVVWYADKYRPADGGAVDDGYYITAYGIAVKHGFEGDEAAWLETLKGEPGRGFEIRGKYDTVEQLQAAVTGPEIGDAYAVGTAEPYHVFIWGVDGWFDFGTMKGEPGRDGRDGVDGKDGEDGYTPQKGVDYTDGKDGADGYTPQKGVDYFTDADKAEIAREAAKMVEIPEVDDDDAVKYTPEERSEAEQAQARENIGAASVSEVVELGKTIPKVYDWAIAKLPFTEAQISNTRDGAGFVVNPTNFADGKTYFRYHSGPTSFVWTNPNPQKGAVTITVLGWSQYADKATANGFSAMNIEYADGTTGRLQLVNGQVVTMTTDANKVLTQIKGNYDHENWVLLDMDVLSIVADYPAPTGTVKSVNGNLPDEDGNVEIDIPEGGGGGGATDHTLGISGAAVGQIARITAVDGDGVPTAWASVDLPSGCSGGGGEWTKLGSVTLTGTFEKIASYENGIITFESFVPVNGRSYIITNKDGTVLIHGGKFEATDNAGEYKVKNFDNGAVTPTIDISNCFVQNLDADNLVIDNQTKYKRYKTRVSTPVFASHGMRQTYKFGYGRYEHSANYELSKLNGQSLVYETEEVIVNDDIYVKQVGIGSNNKLYSNLTRQATTNETKWEVFHYNNLLSIGTQFEVWGAY